MKKIQIVYWTATGNTEMLAKAFSRGAQHQDLEIHLNYVGDTDPEQAIDMMGMVFGCPAQGTEELDETEFEPYFEQVLPYLKGKPVAIFGSYGWGLGEYQTIWKKRIEAAGGIVVVEPLAIFEVPTQKDMELAFKLGQQYAQMILAMNSVVE